MLLFLLDLEELRVEVATGNGIDLLVFDGDRLQQLKTEVLVKSTIDDPESAHEAPLTS